MGISVKKLNKTNTPIVVINNALNKLSKKVFFPEKVEEANRILKTVGLPELKSKR